MSELDIRTLHAILAIIGFSATITLLALWKAQPNRNGIGYWALGVGCSFFASVLVYLRGTVPDFFSIILGNLFYAWTFLYVLKGVRIFTRQTMYPYVEYLFPTVLVAYFMYFTYVDSNIAARVIGISTVYVLFSLTIVFNLIMAAQSSWQWSARIVALIYGGFALTAAVRLYLAFTGQNSLPFMETSGLEALMIMMGIFLLGGSAMGFTLMAHNSLEGQYRILSQATNQTASSIIITDAHGKIQYVNQAFEQLTGYGMDEVVGKTPSVIKSGQTKPEVYDQLWCDLIAGITWHGEFHNRKKNGDLYWEIASVAPVKQRNGEISHYIAVKENITELKEAEAKIRHLAMHDSLTGLPLKSLCLDRWQQAEASAKRNQTKIALLFIDLDGFKKVNDTCGHSVGDRLLQEIAQRISHCVREMDTVSRIGGDEFIVIIDHLKQKTEVADIAAKIIKASSEPFEVGGGKSVNVSASIGVAMYPDCGTSFDALIERADQAMYRVKETGKNGFVYSDELTAELPTEK